MVEKQKKETNLLKSTVNDYISLFTSINPLRPYKKGGYPHNITPRITNLANIIKELSRPEEVINIIFENPPSVTVDIGRKVSEITRIPRKKKIKPSGPITTLPAPNEDLEYVKKPISITKVEDSKTRKVIEEFIVECKTFLATPITNQDGFTDHEERRNYEFGIKVALDYLGKEWSDAFQQKWDNHRFTKNKQHMVTQGFTVVMSRFNAGLTLSKNLINQLKPFFESYQNDIELAMELIGKKRTDLSYSIIVKICKDVIDYFSDESNPANESETRLHKHERSFLENLLIFNKFQIKNTDKNSYLLTVAEKLIGYRVEKLFPFLTVLLQYSTKEFEFVLEKIKKLPDIDHIDLNKLSQSEKTVIKSIFTFLSEAMLKPNVPGNSTRTDIKDLKQPEVVIPDYLTAKVAKVLHMAVCEIIGKKTSSESIFSQVFFQHFTGKTLTVEDLWNSD